MEISVTLYRRLLNYFAGCGNQPEAGELYTELKQLAPPLDLDFAKQLFTAWQRLASEQVGENFWSLPIPLEQIADELEVAVPAIAEQLDRSCLVDLPAQFGNLQLIKNRASTGQAVTFHPPASPAEANPNELKFLVGDRVRVNGQRPQYANHTGTVTQVISVSCRIALDNGWSAFLPHHCLEKI
ncbi:MAG: hypothetical protein SFT94_02335 [Pseudanabaenaceae cyanobacterium bins.68]|nr:hypothetical protein [Pseudanabaenaceae cyanobacterium bins.68]